jgi:hypothetical protein
MQHSTNRGRDSEGISLTCCRKPRGLFRPRKSLASRGCVTYAVVPIIATYSGCDRELSGRLMKDGGTYSFRVRNAKEAVPKDDLLNDLACSWQAYKYSALSGRLHLRI